MKIIKKKTIRKIYPVAIALFMVYILFKLMYFYIFTYMNPKKDNIGIVLLETKLKIFLNMKISNYKLY